MGEGRWCVAPHPLTERRRRPCAAGIFGGSHRRLRLASMTTRRRHDGEDKFRITVDKNINWDGSKVGGRALCRSTVHPATSTFTRLAVLHGDEALRVLQVLLRASTRMSAEENDHDEGARRVLRERPEQDEREGAALLHLAKRELRQRHVGVPEKHPDAS